MSETTTVLQHPCPHHPCFSPQKRDRPRLDCTCAHLPFSLPRFKSEIERCLMALIPHHLPFPVPRLGSEVERCCLMAAVPATLSSLQKRDRPLVNPSPPPVLPPSPRRCPLLPVPLSSLQRRDRPLVSGAHPSPPPVPAPSPWGEVERCCLTAAVPTAPRSPFLASKRDAPLVSDTHPSLASRRGEVPFKAAVHTAPFPFSLLKRDGLLFNGAHPSLPAVPTTLL